MVVPRLAVSCPGAATGAYATPLDSSASSLVAAPSHTLATRSLQRMPLRSWLRIPRQLVCYEPPGRALLTFFHGGQCGTRYECYSYPARSAGMPLQPLPYVLQPTLRHLDTPPDGALWRLASNLSVLTITTVALQELSVEWDPARITQLVEELKRAFD